jgi:hypothetical protein
MRILFSVGAREARNASQALEVELSLGTNIDVVMENPR